MVTETAAEAVGLCLAPVQSLGSVEQVVMVFKKKKNKPEREIFSAPFPLGLIRSQTTSTPDLLPGGACLPSSLVVPQDVCIEEQPEQVW